MTRLSEDGGKSAHEHGAGADKQGCSISQNAAGGVEGLRMKIE